MRILPFLHTHCWLIIGIPCIPGWEWGVLICFVSGMWPLILNRTETQPAEQSRKHFFFKVDKGQWTNALWSLSASCVVSEGQGSVMIVGDCRYNSILKTMVIVKLFCKGPRVLVRMDLPIFVCGRLYWGHPGQVTRLEEGRNQWTD